MKKYYCINCKLSFESDRKGNIECPDCHDKTFVKAAEKKEKKTLSKKYQELRKKHIKLMKTNQRNKFYLKLEHNIVSTMKKYVPTTEDFRQCLLIAKKETINKNRDSYRRLLEDKMIKETIAEFRVR